MCIRDRPTTAKQEQRTLAVQISEDMFQQLKSYLDAHSPLTQKALVQSLLNQALDQWEQGEEPLQDATLQDNKKERTLAIAMPESLFHRVEQYVDCLLYTSDSDGDINTQVGIMG